MYFRTFAMLCRRHPVQKLAPDGHANKEMLKFGSDRYISGHSWWHIAPSYDPRLNFSGSGSNFVSGLEMFGMPKNAGRHCEGSFSYNNFALRKAVVKPFCQILLFSSLLRVNIGAIWYFSHQEGNMKATRRCQTVLGRQHDYVKSPQYRRVVIVF
jgi:hypothetical protein